MKALFLLLLATSLACAQLNKSSLHDEPGTITLEGLLAKPIRLTVKQESTIYYQAIMDRALGSMAAGTPVTLVAMSDTAYRVRGRARHGDVAGWMRADDLILPDPQLPQKLKAHFDRQQKVAALIENRQIGIGMTRDEVQQSLGKPTRTTSKLTAAGREEKLEYAVFEKVPQTVVGRAPDGQLVQSVIYVKVEVGTLSISFKDSLVEAIEETKGNPLRGTGVQIVPVPIMVW
jgi:hypothetical protein